MCLIIHPVSVSFTVDAVAIPDGTNTANPDQATSNINVINVVSESSSAEVSKHDTASEIIRDVNGNPVSVRVYWTILVEVKNPHVNGQVKGIGTSNLGNVSLVDQLGSGAGQWAGIQNSGTLVDCRDWTGQVWTSDVPWSRYNNGDWGPAYRVEDSGTWSCSQPGGTGTDISVSGSNIKWAPRWYASYAGYSGAYWGHGLYSANDQYNTPNGYHNVAAVASQAIVVDYPYSAVVAFDGQPGDLYQPNPNYVRWCNDANAVSVTGSDPLYTDSTTNDRGCVTVVYGINYTNHSKSFLSKDEGNIARDDLGFVPSGIYAAEDFVAPNHRFINRISTENQSSSFQPLSGVTMCDAIDTTKNTFIPTSDITFSAWYWHDKTQSAWYNTRITGTPVFGTAPTNSDVQVEFAATNALWASDQDMREYNCDDPGLVWVSDPSTHPSGVANVNLVRVILNAPLPPGINVTIDFAQKALSTVTAGDVLRNYMQYKDSTDPSWHYAIDPWGNKCELSQPAPNGVYQYTTTCDRLFVRQPKALLLDSDTTWAPCSLNSCIQDWAVSTNINSNWTFNLKGGLIWNSPAIVTGVKVWDVLPPDLSYVSSTITPTLIVQDCDASINPSCIDTPAARTNIGYKTLMWDRGDVTFTPSNPDQGVMSENTTLFGDWQVTTHVQGHLPSGIYLQNRAWLTVDSGAEVDNLPPSFSVDSMETNTPTVTVPGTPSHNEYIGSFNYDWIQTVAYDEFSVTKEVVDGTINLNGTVEYDLGYGNKAGSTKSIDGIDILPFVGDGRLPASVIDGGFSTSIDLSRAPNINTVYITDAPSVTLDRDPNNNSLPGTGIWTCLYSQRDTVGCPASNNITGIRFLGSAINVGQYGTIRVSLHTFGNNGSEIYTNNWMARASGLLLPVYSDDVEAITPEYGKIGDYVWEDINNNGTQDIAESGIDGVTVELLDSLGNPVDDPFNPGNPYIVVTGDNPATPSIEKGWYQFIQIIPGSYIVRVHPSPGAVQSYDSDGSLDNQTALILNNGEVNSTTDFGYVLPIPAVSVNKTLYGSHDSGGQCQTPVAKDEIIIIDTSHASHDITYCFTVTNTGTSYLNNLTLDDMLLTIDQTDITLLSSISDSIPLAPGHSVTYYFETTMSSSLDNSVTVTMTPVSSSGISTGQNPVSSTDTAARFIYIYDPPYGVKSGTTENKDQIEWRMVWVNDSTHMASNVVITDQVPSNMDYVGSLVCQAYGSTTVSSCIYEAPTFLYPNGRVVVTASLAPDPGVTPQQSATATNRLEIRFLSKSKYATDTHFENQAKLAWDIDNDGVVDSITTTDDLKEPGMADPTIVTMPPRLANSGVSIKLPILGSMVLITAVALLYTTTKSTTYYKR